MAERAALRILIVDDDPAIAQLLTQVLTGSGFPRPAVVGTGHEALTADPVDVVILDHQLPDTTGLELITPLRARPGHPSVILVTAHGGESVAASALRKGADDYLIKDEALPKLLPEVLERVRRVRAVREALAAAERDLVNAERLAAIGELMVTLHHEINNPLMAASTEIQLLLETPGLPAAQHGAAEAVRQSLDRIRDVLHRARELEDARSRPYLENMGMIDLKAEHTPPGVSRGDALVWIQDEEIARVAGVLLRHAGFTIQNIRTRDDLQKRAGILGVTLVLIGAAPADPPLGGFLPERPRAHSIVALTTGDGAAERAAGADLVIELPFDPGSFAEEVLRGME